MPYQSSFDCAVTAQTVVLVIAPVAALSLPPDREGAHSSQGMWLTAIVCLRSSRRQAGRHAVQYQATASAGKLADFAFGQQYQRGNATARCCVKIC
jgi:hypothetical protein